MGKKEHNGEKSPRRKGERAAVSWLSRSDRHLEGWGVALRGEWTEVMKE